MNVLHVHTIDVSGGGAKMVFEINRRLNGYPDTSSQLLVGTKESDEETVIELNRTAIETGATRVLERYLSLDGLGSPSSLRLRRIIAKQDVDVVHIHNIHGGYFNMLNLALIPESVAVVWTFHDMWPITGNCVYSLGCERFKNSCGSCPQLDEYPSLRFDTTPVLLSIKERLFDCDLTVAAPSEWMYEKVTESRLDQVDLRHVPNGIDTDYFSPRDRERAREYYDVPVDDRVVLFVASSVDSTRKGLGTLLDALDHLSGKGGTSLLAIGGGDLPEDRVSDEFTVRTPGYIPEEDLPVAYSAADICVVPSLAESFGLVATEAMACETPAVVSAVGGLQEQVDPENGWLAEPGNARSFAEAIRMALQNETRDRKGELARQHVLENYRIEDCVGNYHDLYAELG